MDASEGVGRVSDPPSNSPESGGVGQRPALLIAAAAGLAVLLYFFPLFRIVPLSAPAAATGSVAFDPVAAAAKIWKTDLPAAAPRALELRILAPALRQNAETAKATFAKSSGLGAAYYFVRGSGRVVARDRNHLRVALDGTGAELVALRVGPVFGNTVRDGCGLLDLNAFPGLQEFNALSAELNALVEKSLLPALREQAVVGTTVHFAGCAEAPESAPDAGEPLLTIVPVNFSASK
jgi:predicted lipoprotein